jgi:hypothetical protein
MKFSLYLRNISEWDKVPLSVKEKLDTVFCGDYGCPKALPSVNEITAFQKMLTKDSIKLHYISPKITDATIQNEEKRILEIVESGASVSINDWGMMYRLNTDKKEGMFYLGRLLTKSISDWVWSSEFFKNESENSINYLSQNSFNQSEKFDFFRNYGIRGIEVNIHENGEKSLPIIQKSGFSIIGFADNVIAAVSRSCLLLRLERKNYAEECGSLCDCDFKLVPSDEKSKNVYPDLYLRGNVIYQKNTYKPQWSGYDMLVYTWPEITEII